MNFLVVLVAFCFSILPNGSLAFIPTKNKQDFRQAQVYGKCVKITERFFYFFKLKTTFVCPPSFLNTENNRNLLNMSDDDHLIIRNDTAQTKFYGNFDVEFINILQTDQCRRRTCKVKSRGTETKKQTYSYYECKCCPVLKSVASNGPDCQAIKKTIHREFDLIEDKINQIDPTRMNCTTINNRLVDSYYGIETRSIIHNLICSQETPTKNFMLS